MKIANPLAVKGEDIAVEFLKKNNYSILERNFRKQYGEIDIIALDKSEGKGNEILVFVEVKTRSSQKFGTPLEAISKRKIHEITKTGYYYKLVHPSLPDALRIDAVAIEIESDNTIKTLELIKNISS